MSLKLNLGDIVWDKTFGTKVIVVAKRNKEGKPEILEGYENNCKVDRNLPLLTKAHDRVVIVLKTEPYLGLLSGFLGVGDGYYTWTDDPELVEEVV